MPTNQPSDFKSHATEVPMKESDFVKTNPLPERQMTFGEQLVGISFNPANDDKVAKAKRLCADLMDLAEEEFKNRETSKLSGILYNHTVGEILNAQMNVVKLLTLKY